MQQSLFLSLLLSIFCITGLSAQNQISVRIDSAIVTTACDDIFSGPDPTYQVSVNNNPFVNFDFGANPCFVTAPSTTYDTLVDGACNMPATLEVCFRVMDNDGDFIPCFVLPECLEETCMTFNIPAAGLESQENISIQGSSDGELYFTIATTEAPDDFNYICSAVDFGTLDYGETFGDPAAGIYDNSCADNLNEINPVASGTNLPNNHGVWFKFTTGTDIASLIYVRLFSDPENVGDIIDLETIVYYADSCTGELERFPLFRRRSNGDDTSIELYCPVPETDYYVLVDGRGTTDSTQTGIFSIEIEDTGLPEGGDLRCEATDLGVVPEGGSVSLDTPQANFCSGFSDDPPVVAAFNSRNSVWVSFFAPSSGHVMIEGTSEGPLGIDLELAFYQSPTDNCNATFQHLYSQIDNATFDNSFEMTCLDPGRPYWILVDGSAQSDLGYFDMTVTDLGDIRPVGMRFDTVCAGDSLLVAADIVYDATGIYTDTVKIGNTNCDSIIITDLFVLDPLVIDFVQTMPAVGPSGTNGEGMVSATGGAGSYTFDWCDGTTGSTNTMLVAGTNCCIMVTDEKGCTADTCFIVDFAEPLVVAFSTDSVVCNGESNGGFTFNVSGDRPDYAYSWSNFDGSLTDGGILAMESVPVTATNLPAGDYTVMYGGEFFDTSFVITISEPDLLTISIDQVDPISCFEACDGTITVTTAGGSGSRSVMMTPPAAGAGCAGTYTFVVTDANNCTATISQDLIEPAEFIASIGAVNDVSCFNGDDGSITISTNGNPIQYEWSNNATTATINGLTPGTYEVTVTNDDGCQDIISQEISQPLSPLSGSIEQLQLITCSDSDDGVLRATASGGSGAISFQWSTGQTTATIQDLGPANYVLTITDALGCTIEENFTVQAPLPLLATVNGSALRCPDPLDAGSVNIPNVAGGVGPYLFSIDGGNSFTPDSLFVGLTAGRYDIIIQDALGCEIAEFADVLPAPELIVDLGADRQILLGDSIAINAIANSTNLVYNWSTAPGFQGQRLFERPQENLTVSLSVVDTITDCTASASVRILVDRKPRVYVPTAFSPNGDGVNDLFFPFGGSDVSFVTDFRIFGRYGDLVFERTAEFSANDPDNGWDGKVGTEAASIGVYIYSAKVTFFDGRTEIIKGDVTLLR